jgi:signal transduction histidine kinase/DNA-binding response OmpR family regulator
MKIQENQGIGHTKVTIGIIFRCIFLSVFSFSTPNANAIDQTATNNVDIYSLKKQLPLLATSSSPIGKQFYVDIKKRTLIIALPDKFRAKQKELYQFLIRFWKAWGKQSNFKVSFKKLAYADAIIALENGDIDMISIGDYDKNYKNKFYFSIPYAEHKTALYRHKKLNYSIKPPESIKLAVHSASEIGNALINQDKMNVSWYKNIKELLDKSKEYDYIYSNRPELTSKVLSGLLALGIYQEIRENNTPNLIRTVVLRRNRQLALDINEGLRKIDKNSVQVTFNLTKLEHNSPINFIFGNYLAHLPLAQQDYILDNPVLDYGVVDGGFPPYQIIRNGLLSGFSNDKLHRVSKRLGITFIPNSFSTLNNALQALKEEKIALLPLISVTKERREHFLFSKAIDKSLVAVISKEENKFTKKDSLQDKRIVVSRGGYLTSFIERTLPNATLIYVDSNTQALLALAKGQADAYFSDVENTAYLIKKLKLTGLSMRISKYFDTDFMFYMSVVKSNTELQSILNFGLSDINDAESKLLSQKWKNTMLIQKDDERYQQLFKTTIGISLIFLVLLIAYLLCQRRQRCERNSAIELALLEAQCFQKKAERATKKKTEFLVRMSHEIRTPMSGVLGMAEALSFTHLGTDQSDLLRTLNGSAKNLMVLLNDILDFSKMDAGKLTLESIPMNIGALINGVFDNFRCKAKTKGLLLSIDIADNIQQNYLGDPTRLMQVLNNLVSNSIKFTDQGFIQISVYKTKCLATTDTEAKDQDQLIFEVRDSGIGIAPDKLDSLFSPFVQTEENITRRFGGSGLGLSICKEILDVMKGNIQVSSILGLGSLFTMNLSLQVSDKLPSLEIKTVFNVKDEENNIVLPSVKILLVEDNAVNRKVLSGQIQRLRLTVDMAENGMSAYQMYLRGDYDIILSDCHMPIMDGFTLARKIADERDGPRPQLIAITADTLSDAVSNCITAGFDDYLSKPCSIDTLRAKLSVSTKKLAIVENKMKNSSPFTKDLTFETSLEQLDVINAQAHKLKMQECHLNRDYTMMMCGDDIDLILEILDVFIETNDKDRNELILAEQQSHYLEIKDLGHKIKGGVRYLGANRLGELAQNIEKNAKNKNEKQLKHQVNELNLGLKELACEVIDWSDELALSTQEAK